MRAMTVFVSTDGSEWPSEGLCLRRDDLDAAVRAIEATLPEPPTASGQRVAVDPDTFRAAKVAVVELCRREMPTSDIWQHDPMVIHPFSYAGRLLDDVGGPLRRVWYRFMCHHDGWMYEQPYFATHPEAFRAQA